MNVPTSIRAAVDSEFAISVLVPTHNRVDSLMLCLAHLEAQTWRDFEVILVDDGSTDATPRQVQEYIDRSSLEIRYIRQENRGPARARNVGVSLSRSPVCVMIGDDILVSPGFLAAHLEVHRERPGLGVAVVGLTRWCTSRQTVTRFMRWLDESGMQFGYADLEAGVPPCWHHFYTSNLSLKTETLRRFSFDERFNKAATEDLELGYRIEKQLGLNLVYVPLASAEHLHPTTFLQSCRRMKGVGESMRTFHQIWPELREPSRGAGRVRSMILRNGWILRLVTKLGDFLTRFWCPNPVMRLALKLHYGVGYQAWRTSETNGDPAGKAGGLPAPHTSAAIRR